VKRLLAVCLFLNGCTPYVFGGIGHAGEAGKYPWNEQGTMGVYGIGVEFDHDIRCEYFHRSMIGDSREVVTNDLLCIKHIYFGERR
jgi:hypothetical protein